MIVNEIFYSLQGEGSLAGVPSIFVRLAGCPLRCRWCDTKYAWEGSAGKEMSAQEIAKQITEFPTRYVVLTGGEPLIHQGLAELTCVLHKQGFHVTIETSGMKYSADLMTDLMSISPKLLNSQPKDAQAAAQHDKLCFNLSALQGLIYVYPYQLKFVVDTPQDLDQIADCLDKLVDVDPYKIYLMPQAAQLNEYLEKSRWLAEYCLKTGFSLSQRLQVMLWENQRGK